MAADATRELARLRADVGALLNQIMQQGGISKRQLAYRAGVDPARIRGMLTGASYTPSLRSIVRVFAALGYRLEIRAIQDAGTAPDE